MAISVSIWSSREGEIKRFLERYYGKTVDMDEDIDRWIYVYSKPLEAVDLISTVIDNNDKYQLGMYIQVDEGDIHLVTLDNHNDIIKGIFCLFYDCEQEIRC